MKCFDYKLVTELLALCPKRCKKSYLVISSNFLVRVFRQCTFARYALNGHNYFCLQDNEIRCCEVKIMGASQTLFEVANLWFISNIFQSLTELVELGGQWGICIPPPYFDRFKSKTFSIRRPCGTGAIAPHSFEISWNYKKWENFQLDTKKDSPLLWQSVGCYKRERTEKVAVERFTLIHVR